MTSKFTAQNICGASIKRIRENHEPPITQENLAAKLQMLGWDITRYGISKIERGERKISDIELVLLSIALEVKFDELLGDHSLIMINSID